MGPRDRDRVRNEALYKITAAGSRLSILPSRQWTTGSPHCEDRVRSPEMEGDRGSGHMLTFFGTKTVLYSFTGVILVIKWEMPF